MLSFCDRRSIQLAFTQQCAHWSTMEAVCGAQGVVTFREKLEDKY
jgi:hypothetical protein